MGIAHNSYSFNLVGPQMFFFVPLVGSQNFIAGFTSEPPFSLRLRPFLELSATLIYQLCRHTQSDSFRVAPPLGNIINSEGFRFESTNIYKKLSTVNISFARLQWYNQYWPLYERSISGFRNSSITWSMFHIIAEWALNIQVQIDMYWAIFYDSMECEKWWRSTVHLVGF